MSRSHFKCWVDLSGKIPTFLLAEMRVSLQFKFRQSNCYRICHAGSVGCALHDGRNCFFAWAGCDCGPFRTHNWLLNFIVFSKKLLLVKT